MIVAEMAPHGYAGSLNSGMVFLLVHQLSTPFNVFFPSMHRRFNISSKVEYTVKNDIRHIMQLTLAFTMGY